MVRHGEMSCKTSLAATSGEREDFCYLLQDPKRRHEPGDQAWATTPVMVDVAAQNPLCAAMSTKSDENAYLTAMCAAFVNGVCKKQS